MITPLHQELYMGRRMDINMDMAVIMIRVLLLKIEFTQLKYSNIIM